MKPSHSISKEEFIKLFEEACAFHQNSQVQKAEEIYSYLVEIEPNTPILTYNYGLLLYESQRFKEALKLYQHTISMVPDDADVLYNYALCLKKCGHYEKTIEAYNKILTANPNDLDSRYNLACCHKDNLEDEKAIYNFEQVLLNDPEHISSLNNLAYLFHKNDKLREATTLYKKLLNLQPDHVSANYMLSCLEGKKIDSAPKKYVTDVFDSYSQHYERSLVDTLQYDVPNTMRHNLSLLGKDTHVYSNGLDLGCGTGLAGVAFKDIVTNLTGIDISSRMIEIAKAKGIYYQLFTKDIEEFLSDNSLAFDLIIAADVFTYLGNLDKIIKLLFNVSTKNSLFCFSTEISYEADIDLRQTGRFAHSISYIQKIAKQSGWKFLKNIPTDLRKEQKTWVKGMIYVLEK